MSRRALAAILLSSLALGLRAQEPSFTSTAASVVVDVSVTSNGKPVVGLTARDFALADNGVRQSITDVSRETLPTDVTFVADISGSVEGPLLDAFRRAIARARAELRADDRASLVIFDPMIREIDGIEHSVLAISASAAGPPGTGVGLHDAVAASLIRRIDPARRPMALVFTNGQDVGSFLDEADLLQIAAQSGVTVFVVALTDGTARVPQQPGNRRLLEGLAETTGGAVLVVQRDEDLGAPFAQAIEDFRSSYVLRYTPMDVAPDGWHDLEVQVTRPGRFEVRARAGYIAEPAAAGP